MHLQKPKTNAKSSVDLYSSETAKGPEAIALSLVNEMAGGALMSASTIKTMIAALYDPRDVYVREGYAQAYGSQYIQTVEQQFATDPSAGVFSGPYTASFQSANLASQHEIFHVGGILNPILADFEVVKDMASPYKANGDLYEVITLSIADDAASVAAWNTTYLPQFQALFAQLKGEGDYGGSSLSPSGNGFVGFNGYFGSSQSSIDSGLPNEFQVIVAQGDPNANVP
jgi:hypothetical protein